MNAIENVSRRSFLKGLVSVGALVLSARYYPELVWAEGLPKDPQADLATLASPCVCRNRYGRNGSHRRASLRDGYRDSHFSAASSGR